MVTKSVLKLSVILLLLSLLSQANAHPAAWYQWRSKLNDDFVCRQTPPGVGWERVFGPFRDPHCMYRVR